MIFTNVLKRYWGELELPIDRYSVEEIEKMKCVRITRELTCDERLGFDGVRIYTPKELEELKTRDTKENIILFETDTDSGYGSFFTYERINEEDVFHLFMIIFGQTKEDDIYDKTWKPINFLDIVYTKDKEFVTREARGRGKYFDIVEPESYYQDADDEVKTMLSKNIAYIRYIINKEKALPDQKLTEEELPIARHSGDDFNLLSLYGYDLHSGTCFRANASKAIYGIVASHFKILYNTAKVQKDSDAERINIYSDPNQFLTEIAKFEPNIRHRTVVSAETCAQETYFKEINEEKVDVKEDPEYHLIQEVKTKLQKYVNLLPKDVKSKQDPFPVYQFLVSYDKYIMLFEYKYVYDWDKVENIPINDEMKLIQVVIWNSSNMNFVGTYFKGICARIGYWQKDRFKKDQAERIYKIRSKRAYLNLSSDAIKPIEKIEPSKAFLCLNRDMQEVKADEFFNCTKYLDNIEYQNSKDFISNLLGSKTIGDLQQLTEVKKLMKIPALEMLIKFGLVSFVYHLYKFTFNKRISVMQNPDHPIYKELGINLNGKTIAEIMGMPLRFVKLFKNCIENEETTKFYLANLSSTGPIMDLYKKIGACYIICSELSITSQEMNDQDLENLLYMLKYELPPVDNVWPIFFRKQIKNPYNEDLIESWNTNHSKFKKYLQDIRSSYPLIAKNSLNWAYVDYLRMRARYYSQLERKINQGAYPVKLNPDKRHMYYNRGVLEEINEVYYYHNLLQKEVSIVRNEVDTPIFLKNSIQMDYTSKKYQFKVMNLKSVYSTNDENINNSYSIEGEGCYQHHCLYNCYKDQLVKGTYQCVVLRKLENPGKPYITIGFENGVINQTYGVNDSRLTDEECKMILHWLKNGGKGIKISRSCGGFNTNLLRLPEYSNFAK